MELATKIEHELQPEGEIAHMSKSTAINSSFAWIVWGCAAWFYFYEYLLRASPSVMTHELMRDFGVTATTLGVLTSFYYYSYVALQAPCGVIVDWLGPRRVITFSAILCVVGTYFFAEASSLWEAQVGRFLIGAGSACGYLSCAKVGAEWFSASRFALITSLTMMMGTFGGIFGGYPMGILVGHYGWRPAMMIMVYVGLAVTLASWLIVRDHPKDVESSNYARSKELGVLEGLRIIIQSRYIWIVGFYGFLMYVPLSAFAELWGIPYVMETYHVSKETASLASIMVFLGMGLGCPVAAYCTDYFKSHKKVMSYAAILSGIFFLIAVYVPNIPLEVNFGILFIAGLFNGGQILYFAAAKAFSPAHASGASVGFTNGLLMSSGIFFQPLLGKLLDSVWSGHMTSDGVRLYTASDYQFAMTAIPVSLILAYLVIKLIPETYGKNHLEGHGGHA